MAVVDPVLVVIGGRVVSPGLAAAAVGTVGVVLVPFRIPDDLDLAVPTSVVFQVRDAMSNSLPLTIQ
jgi:uncharacterized protein (TIGR03437 family)